MCFIYYLLYFNEDFINFFIDFIVCFVKYFSIDEVVDMILKLGEGFFMVKLDIKFVFRFLFIVLGDFDLLGFQLEGYFYFDKMVLFGLLISCVLWEKFVFFLYWFI